MKCQLLFAVLLVAGWFASVNSIGGEETTEAIPVGAATVDITPAFPVRLSGYGARRTEAEGVAQKLWAKALAIGGDEGHGEKGDGPAVLITLENCGVTTAIVDAVVAKINERLAVAGKEKLPRERLAVSVSHSHTAPCLTNWAPFIFGADLPPEQQQHVDQYTQEVIGKMADVALAALASRRPAKLAWGTGKVDFAVNRRTLKDGRWTGFGVTPDGPVDHSLQILTARDADGKLIAVMANYACHCTTLGGDFNRIAGDWAGFAQEYIEQENPDATAFITIGCGADANPNPRGTFEMSQQHGRTLAAEVARLLKTELKPLTAAPNCKLTHVELPFETLPTKEQWQERAKAGGPTGYHAEQFLKRLEAGQAIPTTLTYPIGTWTFGDELAMVFLGGEVVVDYAIRMKSEFDESRLWITAYANDVVCYIPSQRILREGGYEADFSMIYYARPTRLAAATEDTLLDGVQKLLPAKFYAQNKQADFPPPKSPEESLAAIKLRPGMAIELVAAEPLIADPVAFDWGPDGRLWVVEMRDYPNGLGWNFNADPIGKPGGRVKVLDDTDGDGRYDKATLFLDEIPFPTGIKVWRNGVLVTAAPAVFFAADTDGDDRADVRETLYEGFGEGNQQHRVNGLRWGLDGWLYIGNGDSDGVIKSVKTGAVVDVRGRDLRIRPDTGEIDAQSGRTQFGRDRNDWGDWFGGNNSNPMWHYLLEDHYLRRNPHFAPPAVTRQISVQPGPAPVFPASRTLARFNDFDRADRFTSACSPTIYRDELLGEAFRGNSFVCEPVHNLVHREIVAADGVSFTSRRPDDEQQSEFLASSDNWFRPSMVRTGPDGALWISDMYRLVIEHPKWIPEPWQRKLDLRAGDTMGRIYRVFPADARPRAIPQFDKLDTAGLVAALDSPNGWQRDMVQQMFFWRGAGAAAVEPLEKLATSAERPTTRLQALCTLDGLGKLRPEVVLAALQETHPGVRRHAIRLCETRFPNDFAPLREQFTKLAADPDPMVRLQLSYSLGYLRDPAATDLLAKLALAADGDAVLEAAVISSLNPDNIVGVLQRLATGDAEKSAPHREALIGRLIGMAALMNRGDEAAQQLVRLLTDSAAPNAPRPAARQFALLANALDVLVRQRPASAADLRKAMTAALPQALKTAADPQRETADRIHAVRLIGHALSGAANGETAAGQQTLAALLDPTHPPELQTAAVEALGRINTAASLKILLADWPARTPVLRAAILDQLLAATPTTQRLLEKIAAGELPAADLDARRRTQLLEHRDESIRRLAARVLQAPPAGDRANTVEQFQDVLALPVDLTAGKAAFEKKCSVCHRLGEIGFTVGPDLVSLTDKSPQAMLVALLDPNRAVEDKFRDYVCVTIDGKQHTGILTAETGNSITLTGQSGKQAVILRGEIEELRATGKSLMPDGLEKDVSKADLANIIGYVRETTQPGKIFDGNQPAVIRPAADGTLNLLATNCKIVGPKIVFESQYKNLGWWSSEQDRALWKVELAQPGRYRVDLDFACHESNAGNKFVLAAGDQRLTGTVPSTGTWDDYRQQSFGELTLPAGSTELLMRSAGPINTALIDLRGIKLTRLPATPSR